MREMHLSWRELQETPAYVRAYSLHFLNAVNERENRKRNGA